MEKIAKGRVFVFGANIDTDQIYPGRYLELTDPKEVGKHALEGADPNLVKEFKPGDIIVASTNFGCGSSREQAAITLKAIDVGAILADSFARIFYRNAINIGLPILECAAAPDLAAAGDRIAVDLEKGTIADASGALIGRAVPFPGFILELIQAGGLVALLRRESGLADLRG
jgi:3-isopropylmalate/(R)-2-methylmalate dehydratase small subunit